MKRQWTDLWRCRPSARWSMAAASWGAPRRSACPKATASRYVGELETRLGVRLLHRTTRRLSLTGDGERFTPAAGKCSPGSRKRAELHSRSGAARGLLRINARSPSASGTSRPCGRVPGSAAGAARGDAGGPYRRSRREASISRSGSPRFAQFHPRLPAARPARASCCAPRPPIWRPMARPGCQQTSPATRSSPQLLVRRRRWQFDRTDGRVSVRTRPAVHTNSGDTCRAMALAGKG